MTREHLEEILDDVVQRNGKKAHDCADTECDLIVEFYYKLTELQTFAERLGCWPIRHTQVGDHGLSGR